MIIIKMGQILIYIISNVLTSCDVCQERDFLRWTANPLRNSRVAFSIHFCSYTGVKVTIKQLKRPETKHLIIVYDI